MKKATIYIHGITPSEKPGSHSKEYNRFHQGLQSRMPNYDPLRIDLEWGYINQQSQTTDRLLSDVQNKLYRSLRTEIEKETDFTLNPLRFAEEFIRRTIYHGFSDMFFYVSEAGKQEIRKNIFSSIANQLLSDPHERISLDIIAHSAGTVIMHDFLYEIFSDEKVKSYYERSFRTMKDLFQDGTLSVNSFITMGSPIGFLSFRSDRILQKMYNDGKELGKLNENDLGFKGKNQATSPKWFNFWDKDDLISSPVSFLYKNENALISDYHPDFGDFFPSVHNSYWASEFIYDKVAEAIKNGD